MDLPKKLPNKYNQEYLKEELKKVSIDEINEQKLNELWNGKIELLWTANDLAKEGNVEKAMKIAESYYTCDDDDPTYSEELGEAIKKGEESRIITTVKGVTSWLLQSIIVECINRNSDPQYYTRSLNIIEKLAGDKNLYVRQQATVPLEILAANIKALTHRQTGESFKFLTEDRKRTEEIAFKMLNENMQWDRILEYLGSVFNRMRYLSEKEAMHALGTFFYKGTDLRPNYVTEKMVALAIYYAEFRSTVYVDGFNGSEFKKFLHELIDRSSEEFKSHTLWVIRKNYKKEEFERIEPYLPLFLSGKYSDDVRVQWDFLVERVLEDDLQKSFSLLKDSLNYTKKAIAEGQDIRENWFYLDRILQRLFEQDLNKFKEIIPYIQFLQTRGVRIGGNFLEKIHKEPEESQ